MKILVVAPHYPMPDRTAGDLRFFALLRLLALKHEVWLGNSAFDPTGQHAQVGVEKTESYKQALEDLGVEVIDSTIRAALASAAFDTVVFEFYFSSEYLIDDVRFYQRNASIVVDSVDVAYYRLLGKARLTGNRKDEAIASAIKKRELAVYKKADMVITVSEEDRKLLLAESRTMRVEIVPLIHGVLPFEPATARLSNTLLFVGAFSHDPNADAMLYFCREVFPLILEQCPGTRLRIIGSSASPEIAGLANDNVEVLGFVPDIRPYLDSSYISIAPLRFGGGIKGKISEAMAHGLPVVTTTVGIEGFGLTPSENVLVGDTPQEFARATCSLLRDPMSYERIRKAGWQFVKENLSDDAVGRRVDDLFAQLGDIRPKRLPLTRFLRRTMSRQLERHVLWRFRGRTRNSPSVP